MPTRATTAGYRAALAARGIGDGLMASSDRQRPLDARGHARNPAIAPLRRRSRDAREAAVRLQDGPRLGPGVVDQGWGPVRRAIRTPTPAADETPFLALVRGDEQPVHADKGCDGWYQQDLVLRGIADGIMVSSHRQRPLDARGHACNRAIGKLRAPVERTFAILKRWYGYGRVRYRSLVRNTLQLQRPAVARTRARTGSAD